LAVTQPIVVIELTRPVAGLWCCSSRHHQKYIAKIGRPILALFLIPLVKMILLIV
jgi:hypothetical protein